MDYESPESIYDLLPAVYRIRDAERGYPLKAFLRLITSQVNIVKEDIDRLWDNFFIETCEDWVIPYIGDLVGNNPLHDIERPNRADVAKTIYYRRRKGTLPMLEEMARDVTGWACHTVEFFRLLGWTQHMNHIRLDSNECPDVRDLNAMDLVDSAFDSQSHTVDVRAIHQNKGWYNIRNIGFFLWRLRSYPLENVQAQPVDGPGDYRYHFSPLGNPAHLFHHPPREGDESGLAREIHIPGPIRPAAFYFDMESYYGKGKSVFLTKDGSEVRTGEVICKNLKDWARPPAGKVGIDVKLGRITFAAGEEPSQVTASYYYGFSANLGGGQYERRNAIIDSSHADWEKTVRIEPESPDEAPTISTALIDWVARGKPKGIIRIGDNGIYEETIEIEPADDRWLAIEADTNRRPTLRLKGSGYVDVIGSHPNADLILNGLLIEGGIYLHGSLGKLQIRHCTLVPGLSLDHDGEPVSPNSASIKAVASNTSLEIEIENSIVGTLRLPEEMTRLTIKDSILDGLQDAALARFGTNDKVGPPTVLERTTVFGAIYPVELILANEVIFTQKVFAERTQVGCVRFSYIPDGSQTPRSFRCQPDLALTKRTKELGLDSLPANERNLIRARLQPGFTSVHYGNPGYGQLSENCPEEIKTGAEDGSEMGAFRHLRQPQREANLRIRLKEYLPFGLKPGFIYIT